MMKMSVVKSQDEKKCERMHRNTQLNLETDCNTDDIIDCVSGVIYIFTHQTNCICCCRLAAFRRPKYSDIFYLFFLGHFHAMNDTQSNKCSTQMLIR